MEYLDIINDQDEVIGSATREEIQTKKLSRRIIHILFFNNEGKMVLQLRSKTKSFAPGHWSTAVGGHVQAGETYEQAALRECEEELGITPQLIYKGKSRYQVPCPDNSILLLSIFEAQYDLPFTVSPEEVEKVDYFSLEEIQTMINAGEKFHPELLFLLQNHYGIVLAD